MADSFDAGLIPLEFSGTAAATTAGVTLGVGGSDARTNTFVDCKGRWVTVQLSGTWVGTATFQGSNDGTNYVNVTLNNASNTAGGATATTTSNGLFHGPVTFRYFRVGFTRTSGTVLVNGQVHQSAAGVPLPVPLTQASGWTGASQLAVSSGTGRTQATATTTGAVAASVTDMVMGQQTFGMQVTIAGGTTFSVDLQGSIDGTNYFALGATATDASPYVSVTGKPVRYVRANVNAISAGTLTVNLIGA